MSYSPQLRPYAYEIVKDHLAGALNAQNHWLADHEGEDERPMFAGEYRYHEGKAAAYLWALELLERYGEPPAREQTG